MSDDLADLLRDRDILMKNRNAPRINDDPWRDRLRKRLANAAKRDLVVLDAMIAALRDQQGKARRAAFIANLK